jgi:hypothetical protein
MTLLSDSQLSLSEHTIVSQGWVFAACWHIQLNLSERGVAKAENVCAPDSIGAARHAK